MPVGIGTWATHWNAPALPVLVCILDCLATHVMSWLLPGSMATPAGGAQGPHMIWAWQPRSAQAQAQKEPLAYSVPSATDTTLTRNQQSLRRYTAWVPELLRRKVMVAIVSATASTVGDVSSAFTVVSSLPESCTGTSTWAVSTWVASTTAGMSLAGASCASNVSGPSVSWGQSAVVVSGIGGMSGWESGLAVSCAVSGLLVSAAIASAPLSGLGSAFVPSPQPIPSNAEQRIRQARTGRSSFRMGG